jgi:hypothetical protein
MKDAVLIIATIIVTTFTIADSHAAANWQLHRLMTPTMAQLVAEEEGQVFIYDELTIAQVDTAMDTHFGRIEHMMFTGIRHIDTTGNTYIEEDGCD